jgi:hypothetical protein
MLGLLQSRSDEDCSFDPALLSSAVNLGDVVEPETGPDIGLHMALRNGVEEIGSVSAEGRRIGVVREHRRPRQE